MFSGCVLSFLLSAVCSLRILWPVKNGSGPRLGYWWIRGLLTQEEIHFHETLGRKTMSQHEGLQSKQFGFPASAFFPILCISLLSSLFTYVNFTSV